MWSVLKMKILILLLVVAASSAKHEQYTGWKSYLVAPQSSEQLKQLAKIAEALDLDFLSHPTVSSEGVVLVTPEQQPDFLKLVQKLNIDVKVHAEDVADALRYDDELIESQDKQTEARNGARIPYNNYQRLAVIDAYLQDIAIRYPERVTLVSPGNSFEGRPIYYLKISTTNFEDTNKPVIVIDGGIHAREWISPPTVTWAIHKLVENVTEPDLLERFDWILLPVVNPDGYEFSHTTSRFWRKTRSTDTSPMSGFCPGVDGNRNYDFYWNTVGTSNSACSDIYAGNGPFSEVETRVVRDILHENLNRIALYLSMHSYGSMILYSWGHDSSLSPNALGLHTVGVAMATAIQAQAVSYFPNYVVGNLGLVLQYQAAGGSMDYAHAIGVPLSYTYELPGLSSGFQGFALPPQYIEQVSRETWEGIAVGARRAGDLFVPSRK